VWNTQRKNEQPMELLPPETDSMPTQEAEQEMEQ
jgi:hypothetical protein